MIAIADAGWIAAFRHRRDEPHAWAENLAGALTLPILTCEALLAEAAFRLESARAVMEVLEATVSCRHSKPLLSRAEQASVGRVGTWSEPVPAYAETVA
jgi:hypothetical protein